MCDIEKLHPAGSFQRLFGNRRRRLLCQRKREEKTKVHEVCDCPRSPEVQKFLLTVLGHLAADSKTPETEWYIVNRLGRSLKREEQRRAISELLKNDLIRFTSPTKFAIHSEAVRYFVIHGYGPFSETSVVFLQQLSVRTRSLVRDGSSCSG